MVKKVLQDLPDGHIVGRDSAQNGGEDGMAKIQMFRFPQKLRIEVALPCIPLVSALVEVARITQKTR